MDKIFYNSPVGILEIAIENDAIISLKLTEKSEKSCIDTSFTKEIKSQLDKYFLKKQTNFDLKVNPKGTEFQKRVWEELRKIPYGKTKSYGEIAESLGNKNSARAVGSACNKNPVMLIVPCHRVIGKNGNLTGFACGLKLKEKLLNLEK